MQHITASNNGNGSDPHSSLRLPGAELGIEVLSLRRSAGGYMLDLRYRVRDIAKAAPIRDLQLEPVLTDQKTGVRLVVPSQPEVESLRQRPVESALDRTYFVLFANPGRLLKAGDRVTLGFGDRRVENLVIE